MNTRNVLKMTYYLKLECGVDLYMSEDDDPVFIPSGKDVRQDECALILRYDVLEWYSEKDLTDLSTELVPTSTFTVGDLDESAEIDKLIAWVKSEVLKK